MPKINLSDVDNIITEQNGYAGHSFDPNSPNYFENFCSACDNFEYEPNNCPFKGKVNGDTRWRSIGCNNFYD